MNSNDVQKQLAKLRRNKKFLWLGILFFVLVVLWILVSIFATTKTSVISQELRNLSKSFVPRLESKVFDEISNERAFSDGELDYFSIFILNRSNVGDSLAPIDIMAITDTSSSSAQELTEQEILEVENTEIEPIRLDSTDGAQLSSPEEASTSSMNVPQSVSDLLDFVVANN